MSTHPERERRRRRPWWVVVPLLAALLLPLACSHGKGPKRRRLNPHFKGRQYINTVKDYQFGLPPAAWRYDKVPGWDAAFHHQEVAAQIFIDSKILWTVKDVDKAFTIWAKDMALYPREMEGEDVDLSETSSPVRGRHLWGRGDVRVSWWYKYSVERSFDAYVFRRGRRYFVFLLVAPPDDRPVVDADFQALVSTFRPDDRPLPRGPSPTPVARPAP